jgi:hypothetical protein
LTDASEPAGAIIGRLERADGADIWKVRKRMLAADALHILEEHQRIAVIAVEDFHVRPPERAIPIFLSPPRQGAVSPDTAPVPLPPTTDEIEG